jgi:glycosyltransferase involved in cell wall biosynthesis
VAVSAGAARSIGRLTGLGEDRIRIIHNPHHGVAAKPVEDPDFAHAWLAHPGSKLVAAGSFLPPKDFPTLLRAFAVLLKTRDARLLILGEGPLRGELEALAQALGIADKVFLPGFTLSPQDWIAQADLFVLSSRWEGFGNVIVEALAQGTPVVSTDCPSGPSEILCGGGLGILAPMGDPDALAAAIEAGLSKTWDRTMLKRRADDFTVPKAATEYLDLLLPNETSR